MLIDELRYLNCPSFKWYLYGSIGSNKVVNIWL